MTAPKPNPPVPQYSFTGFQVANPTARPPGDRLDGEYARLGKAISDTIAWVGTSLNSDGTTRLNRGFIAQDVFEVLGGDITGVDLGSMVAVLWQAVRELSDSVNELEGEKPL